MNILWSQEIDDMTDKIVRQDFLADHGMKHHSIYSAMLDTGVVIGHTPLMDMDDEESWLISHAQEHISVASALGLDIPMDLMRVDFSDKEDTKAWMQMHAYIHSMIDQALGL